MLCDSHIHTHFSGDSDASLKSMITSAKKNKLYGICFTDHLDLDYPQDPELFLLDLPSYVKQIEICKQHYSQDLYIGMGIEIGLQPHLTKELSQICHSYPFDFVIGSSHVVHGQDPYYTSFYENKTEDEAYWEYFSSILENIRVFDCFDVYGHLDYVVRYGPNKNRFFSYEKFKDIIDPILKSLIEKGKGLELNTAGFKYGLNHPNPHEDILKRYHALGGEIITTGSDAHTDVHLAYDFKQAEEILKACGFKYHTVFQNHKPIFLPL